MRLNGKIALITGAAHGMGAVTARRFAAEGATVIIADVLDAEGAEVVKTITARGGQAEYLHLNVSVEADWQAVMGTILARHGRLNILVNNAGISGALPDRLDVAAFDRIVAVNARGTFLGMKFAIETMRGAGGGAIVNVSSISGLIGQEFVHMGYNGAKAAIHVMTKSAAVQYGPEGIRINSVHPGIMPPMLTSRTATDPSLREKLVASIPLRRAGTGEDTANACLFLASDEASYVTGASLVVDGGFTAA